VNQQIAAPGSGVIESDQGLAIKPPAPRVRTDYRKSDADLLDMDPNAPELGDLGSGKPARQPAAADKDTPPEVQINDENEIVTGEPEAKPKPKAEDSDEDDLDPEDDKKPDGEKATEKKPGEEEEIEPLTPGKVSEELKEHFADEKVGRELKNAYFGYQAYKEVIPSIEDARELAQMFPTIQSAREVMDTYDGFSAMQDAFEKDPKGFVEKLHEEGENEFEAVAEALFRQLPDLAPDTYNAVGRQIFIQGLEYIAAEAEAIAAKASRKSGLQLTAENLRIAADVIALNLFEGKKVAELDSPDDEKTARIKHLEADLKAERTNRGDEGLKVFLRGCDSYIDKQIGASIDATIEQLLEHENAKEAVTEKSLAKIRNEILAAVKPALLKDKRLGDELIKASKNGDFGSKHVRLTSKPAIAAAQTLIRRAAAKIIPEWTREILQTNANRIQTQRQQAARPDFVSGGPRITQPTREIQSSDIDYSRTSSEDILSGNITLKKRA
jgi:hypothetical protein